MFWPAILLLWPGLTIRALVAPNESLTQKLPKPLEHAHSNTATSVSTINIAAGTVVVRPEAPLEGGRLPLAHRMGLSNKNIFTPTKLKLETMFQSPSPPQPTAVEPGQHAQESTPAPNLKRPFRFCDDKSNNSFPFTFIQPCSNNPVLTRPADDGHQHDTQSKLRLFQFQYDTYTRDHLSAIIDAIPISASSRSHSSSTTPSNHYARKADIDSPAFRPPKRIKIAPDDEEILTKQVKPRAKRKSFPLARFDHVQETKPARLTSGVSDGIFRSVASSTVNASASLRSFDDELVVELQNVSIVQTERRVGSGSTALTNHTKGKVANTASQFNSTHFFRHHSSRLQCHTSQSVTVSSNATSSPVFWDGYNLHRPYRHLSRSGTSRSDAIRSNAIQMG